MKFRPRNEPCSLNSDDWKEAGRLYCQGKENYHCIPNEFGQFVELCDKNLWIQANFCPVFNTVANKLDATPCDLRHGTCPGSTYLSSDSYKYSACFLSGKDVETSSLFIPNSTEPISTEPNLARDVTVPVAVASTVLAVACLSLVFGFLFIMMRRRNKKRRGSQTGNNEETASMMASREGGRSSHRDDSKEAIPKPCIEIQKHKEDKVFFPRTKAIEDGWKTLSTYGALIVVGLSGSGKTKLGLELGSYFDKVKFRGNFHTCKVIHRLGDLEKELDTDFQNFILLDGCFEMLNVQQEDSAITAIKSQLDSINIIYGNYIKIKKELYLVLTIKTHTWNKFSRIFKDYTLFSTEHILVVDYNTKDKKEMLKCHVLANGINYKDGEDNNESTFGNPENEANDIQNLKNDGPFDVRQNDENLYDFVITENGDSSEKIDEEIVRRITKADTPTIGFPEACAIFCRDKALMKVGAKFFENPIKQLAGRFLGWLKSESNLERSYCCTLLYVLLKGGELIIDDIDYDLLLKVGEICCLDIRSQDVVRKSAQCLTGRYFVENLENRLIFQHEFVEFALLTTMNNRKTPLSLEYYNVETLQRYFRQEKYQPKPGEMLIVVKGNQMKQLTQRLVDSNEYGMVSSSIYMTNSSFARSWKQSIKDKPNEAETQF